MNHINAAGMVASNEWEALSQASFFGSPASGLGMQGGRPPCPGPGRGAPVAEGGPASPPGHPPCQDVMPDASSASPHHGPRSEHSPASGQPPHAGNGPGGHAPAASHPGASNSDA